MTDDVIEFRDVAFRYPDATDYAFNDVSFSIKEGETVLVTGPSGCGKSTLLRCVNGLVPRFSGGRLTGTIRIKGCVPTDAGVADMAHTVGHVFQDPEDQLTQSTVESEIAFGLENRNVSIDDMEARITETLASLGIAGLRQRGIDTLSGGEKQKVVLAAVLALKPDILVCDEPTSQLSPASAAAFLGVVERLAEETNLTLLIAEHRLDRVLPFADRVYDMGCNEHIARERLAQPPTWRKTRIRPHQTGTPPPRIEVEHVSYAYPDTRALVDVSFSLYPGERVALVGENGAGKSTLAKHFNGLLKPQNGVIRVNGEDTASQAVEALAASVGVVGQNPNDYLFSDSVADELRFTLENLGVEGDIDATLQRLGIHHLKEQYPRDLAGGERQRTAIASVLVCEPETLVFDEPTRGLDWATKMRFAELLDACAKDGTTVVVVTHDLPFARVACERAIALAAGRVTFDGPMHEYSSEDAQ